MGATFPHNLIALFANSIQSNEEKETLLYAILLFIFLIMGGLDFLTILDFSSLNFPTSFLPIFLMWLLSFYYWFVGVILWLRNILLFFPSCSDSQLSNYSQYPARMDIFSFTYAMFILGTQIISFPRKWNVTFHINFQISHCSKIWNTNGHRYYWRHIVGNNDSLVYVECLLRVRHSV